MQPPTMMYVASNNVVEVEDGSGGASKADLDAIKEAEAKFLDVQVKDADADAADGLCSNWTKSFSNWRNQPPASPREYSPREIRNRRIACGIFTLVCLSVGIGVLVSSLKKTESTQYGVQYNVHKKKLDDAAVTDGLFLGPPGYKFIKFPSTFITADIIDGACISRDGLRVQFSVTFQYQMTIGNVLPVIIKYRDYMRWADVVEAAGLSAIHHSCSEFNISDFQNKRGQIQATMEDNLKLKLEGDPEEEDSEGVYARAISLQLSNLELPFDYNSVITEKQNAEEDINLARNERKQETTKADTELLTAKETARKILDTARTEAEVLLTEARLKAEETTFSFTNEAETIVEVKDSLNLTTEGVLAYLANTLLSEVQNLKLTMGEPAKLSRSNEL
jgi:vacuolar-type H+-ATPase subunit H